MASMVAPTTRGSDRRSPRRGGHLDHMGTVACAIPVIGNPAHRWRVPQDACPNNTTRHGGRWLDPRLAVAAHGKHLAGGHSSWRIEQLGAVCVQIHEGFCHARQGHRRALCGIFGPARGWTSSTLARGRIATSGNSLRWHYFLLTPERLPAIGKLVGKVTGPRTAKR